MPHHPLPKVKRPAAAPARKLSSATKPASSSERRRPVPSTEKVTTAVVSAVVDQVAAAFTGTE